MTYNIKIIPGTHQAVLDELHDKLKGVKVVNVFKKSIAVSCDMKISEFRVLLSALSVDSDTGKSINLYRRDWKKHHVPASVNPALAYILCKVANISESDVVYDPFCGAGTIVLTAALYFNPIKSFGSDVSGKAIDAAIANNKLAATKATFFRANITSLKLQNSYVTKLISNLPFGIRTGDHKENEKIYSLLAAKADSFLSPNGSLTLLTTEKKLLKDVFKSSPFKIVKEILVEQGKLFPTIFVLKRKSSK